MSSRCVAPGLELVVLGGQRGIELGDVGVGAAAHDVAHVEAVERLAHARQQPGVGRRRLSA